MLYFARHINTKIDQNVLDKDIRVLWIKDLPINDQKDTRLKLEDAPKYEYIPGTLLNFHEILINLIEIVKKLQG